MGTCSIVQSTLKHPPASHLPLMIRLNSDPPARAPAAERAKITKHIGWHTFRRTFSTLLKANGEDVKTVQELLRHATVKMTLEVYTQAVTPAKRNAQSKVAGMLKAGVK